MDLTLTKLVAGHHPGAHSLASSRPARHRAPPCPAPLIGWRFQATDKLGDTQVFDVVRQEDGGWAVLRAWS